MAINIFTRGAPMGAPTPAGGFIPESTGDGGSGSDNSFDGDNRRLQLLAGNRAGQPQVQGSFCNCTHFIDGTEDTCPVHLDHSINDWFI
eukprot:m.273084 g.273084  ORF g.273084 m.273084 type:complete len:89 (-) comp19752_c0_seq2:1586-1852(-)